MATTKITSSVIADDAIVAAAIADDAVVTAAIADDAITAALIADDAVGTAAIADDAITAALIADDAVGTAALASGLTLGGVTTFAGIIEDAIDVSVSGAAATVNLSLGTVFALDLDASITTGNFTWSNPAASGLVSSFTLVVTQDGTGGFSIAWPSAVDWGAATAPTLSTAANAVDVFVFFTVNNGSVWYGFTAGQAMG